MASLKVDISKRVGTSRTFSHLIQQFRLEKKAVLDIGCSEGYYLAHFGEGSMGVTIIPEHVAQAHTNGLSVVLGNIEDPDFSLSKKFDVAWANNLFEHMNAPHLFLMKAREFVSEDGVLILGVPVIPWFSFLAYFKKFRGAYAVSHVNFFTRKTLIETVRAGGWTVKEARLFYFGNRIMDSLLNLIAPHIYIIASPAHYFTYPQKRLLSLRGYADSMEETTTV